MQRHVKSGPNLRVTPEVASVLTKPSMHRHALNRVTSLARFQAPRRCVTIICRGQATQTGEPKATPALLEKMNDKDLLKVHGFIGGQWVAASDGTTMDVRTGFVPKVISAPFSDHLV